MATPQTTPDIGTHRESLRKLEEQLGRVILGKPEVIESVVIALLSGGHMLMEDVPGVGKTTLAKALAKSISADFKRVQFTPDLLPSDILGVSVFDPRDQTFRFHEGPIFTSILLADEINRASPRTQSALLEAMAESQVSVDGTSAPLPELFFVIATQNPVEFRGTYPLPEAQMDRFAMQFGLGYVEPAQEIAILTDQAERHPLEALSACVSLHEVLALRQGVRQVRVTDEVKRYAVDLVRATRTAIGVQLGASPRASLALVGAAQAVALFDGQAFVSPEHVQELAVPVIAHRLALDPQARFSGTTAVSVVEEVVKTIAVPA
jgi:MoxR-like ATPase